MEKRYFILKTTVEQPPLFQHVSAGAVSGRSTGPTGIRDALGTPTGIDPENFVLKTVVGIAFHHRMSSIRVLGNFEWMMVSERLD
jgi:hypothetical protein